MQQTLRLMIAAIVAVALTHLIGVAAAQNAVKQIKLTDQQIEGFINAQKDMSAVAEKMQSNSDKPDPKVQAELESIAKKHGFASFEEYDDVAANISMVMAGIDPQSKAFTEPKVAIQKEIEEVKNDKSIPEKEKKQMLDELGEVGLDAVTTNLNINFLTKPEPRDLVATVRLIRLGRRLAVGEAQIYSDGVTDLVAHAIATYSLPARDR